MHWSQTWQRPKRRSRSKSAKATSYRNPEQNKVSEEGAKDWSVFPGNAPWIPSTPSGRAVNKKTDQSDGVGAKESLVDQSVIQPASSQAAAETLSPEEEKILEHLKGLKSAGIDLTEQMEQQQQKLIAKQQAAAASKALTHGHLNRLTKLKTQVTSAADKVTKLDREWKAFVEATTQKVHQPCRAVSEVQIGSFRGIQHEVGRAPCIETRDEFGIDVNVGAGDSRSDDPRGTQCGGTAEGSRRGDTGRGISGRSGSYKRHGRCGRDGTHGFWTTEQGLTEVAQAVSRSHFSYESGTAASQAEDSRSQGRKDEGKRTECLTQKDSGVERVVPSDSIDVESILAGWWQEFDGLCRVLHTWQQPDEQGLRDELKELSNVPVCQPSIPINDGQPCLDDLLFFKKPESWNVHNCYEVDKGNCAEHDVRVYGENGNNNQRSCLFSRMSVKESALQSCTVGTFDVGHHRQEAEKPCGESSFLTGNGRLKSQHTGIDMEVESASSHAEVHTWIRHAFVRSDTCHEHVFGRSVQKFGSLLRGGRKGNLDLSEPQARAQMHRSESHVKFPSAPNDVWDNGVDPCIESHCNLQSRSDGAGVDVDFFLSFSKNT